MKLVDICRAIRVDPAEQRDNVRQLRKIIPVDDDPGCSGHCDKVHGQIGGTPCCQQTDYAVNDDFFIYQLPDRQIIAAVFSKADNLAGSGIRQCGTQRGIRMNKGRARQMQPHDFHHHLIGIGGAVKGTGSG